jgi:4-diphosphocytidyl-2-C-methyl-D-erythritol kinase
MLFFPNAKINLGLNILRKRSDGYHDIETVFSPVAFADVLEFVPDETEAPGTCHFTATGIPVDGTPESNLIVKAYRLLDRDFRLPAIKVHLHTIIPPGAGLGGGSSDGAFMLKHLNAAFSLELTDERLMEYASALGSDCAFFILNRPVFGYERGNRFRELEFPGEPEAVLVNPGIHVSTAWAYGSIVPAIPPVPLAEVIRLPVEEWKNRLRNDFEAPVVAKHPEIGRIRDALYAHGAVYAAMSGSGSTVFGLFHKKAPDLQPQFPDYFCWSGPLIPEQA